MKRFLAILLAMTLLMTLLPLPALATTGGDGGPDIPVDPPAAEDPPVAIPALHEPEVLKWGVYYPEGEAVSEPGYACFSTVEGAVRYDIQVWKVDGETETLVYTPSLLVEGAQDDWAWHYVCYEIPAGYTYYYTVRAIGDGINYESSSLATSETWYYAVPEIQLEVTDPAWDEENLMLTWTTNHPGLVDRYQYRIYRAETAEGETVQVYFGNHSPEDGGPYFDEIFMEHGSGWYTFRVRALSADATQAADSEWSDFSEPLSYAAPDVEALDAPADLTWHLEYDSEDKETPWMGSMAFTRSVPDQYRYEVAILEDGEEISSCTWRVYEGSTATRFSVDDFVLNDLPSGTYSFAVRALGDYSAYRNSSWAYSEEWTYTRPDGQLDAPTGLVWEERDEDVLLKWNAVDDVKYYQVEILWAETPDGQLEFVTDWIGVTTTEEALTDWELEMYGDGWYFFRVRAVSGDITQICNSDYSEMSQGFYMGDVTNAANGQLEAVDTSGSAADIRDQVAAIDHLDEALAADTGNSGTAKLIEELDTTVGTTTVVTENITDFDKDAVQIYGAALNNAGDATLTIGQPRQDETAPELQASQYRNTLQFSMEITAPDADNNTENGHQLAIPVKLVLPVPETINPAFLVILHHKQSDDSWEVIHPHVYQQDGKWYAAFVTDSFSDFAMANGVEITWQEEQSALRVELTASIDGVTLLCALYDSNHRMLDTAFLTREQTEGALTFGAAEPSYVRIFALDSENRPFIPFEIMDLFEK